MIKIFTSTKRVAHVSPSSEFADKRVKEKVALTPLVKGGKRRGDYCNELPNKNPTTAKAVPLPLTREVKKAAFTLAEVLITLGIIGVVAAMTLPAVITKYQKKQTVEQLKKAYSTFSQALVKSQYDNGSTSEWSVTEYGSSYEDNLKYFETYWKPYLKVIKVCKTMAECGYKVSGYASLANRNEHTGYSTYNNVPGFIYGDGTFAYIRPWGFNNQKLQLLGIDINGAKGPNVLGIDAFQFTIRTDNGVLSPYYYNKENLCTIGGDISWEGSRGCAAKIMKDGWQIKDDYPW